MGVRSLKDLDKIQEKGSILLSARRARSLVAGAGVLVVLAFLVGLQVGRSFAPVPGEMITEDAAAADRTIEEILVAYRAAGVRPEIAADPPLNPPPAEEIAEPRPEVEAPAVEEPPTADEVEADALADVPPVVVVPPPIPRVPVVPEVVIEDEPPTPSHPFDGLPSAGPNGGYAVQLAAFPSGSEAAALARDVTSAGARVYTMQVEVRGETWHRVRVGRFARRDDAQAWLTVLTPLTPYEPIVVAE